MCLKTKLDADEHTRKTPCSIVMLVSDAHDRIERNLVDFKSPREQITDVLNKNKISKPTSWVPKLFWGRTGTKGSQPSKKGWREMTILQHKKLSLLKK